MTNIFALHLFLGLITQFSIIDNALTLQIQSSVM